MYEIIKQIINHSYSGSYLSSEEQMITAVSAVIIVIVFAVFLDISFKIFHNFIK